MSHTDMTFIPMGLVIHALYVITAYDPQLPKHWIKAYDA